MRYYKHLFIAAQCSQIDKIMLNNHNNNIFIQVILNQLLLILFTRVFISTHSTYLVSSFSFIVDIQSDNLQSFGNSRDSVSTS